MGIIASLFRKRKMMEGYEHIWRRSPEHEPELTNTRLTVPDVIACTNGGTDKEALEGLILQYSGIIPQELMGAKLNEAIRYYSEHPEEINRLIAESRARKGMVIKDGRIIREPDGC